MGLFGSGTSAPFDRVEFTDQGGQIKVWTRAEFEKLPLLDRVKLLSGGALRFFRDGKEVPAREALSAV